MAEIVPYDNQYETSVLDLHRRIFLPIMEQNEFTIGESRLLQSLDQKRAMVALQARQLIGFGSYDKVDTECHIDRTNAQDHFQYMLDIARRQQDASALEEQLRNLQDNNGGEAFIEYFTTNFLLSDLQVSAEDYYLQVMALEPAWRRQGIGRRLVEERISTIQQHSNAHAVFACCYQGGHSSKIYERLGFSLIITLSPLYADGSAVKFWGKELPQESPATCRDGDYSSSLNTVKPD